MSTRVNISVKDQALVDRAKDLQNASRARLITKNQEKKNQEKATQKIDEAVRSGSATLGRPGTGASLYSDPIHAKERLPAATGRPEVSFFVAGLRQHIETDSSPQNTRLNRFDIFNKNGQFITFDGPPLDAPEKPTPYYFTGPEVPGFTSFCCGIRSFASATPWPNVTPYIPGQPFYSIQVEENYLSSVVSSELKSFLLPVNGDDSVYICYDSSGFAWGHYLVATQMYRDANGGSITDWQVVDSRFESLEPAIVNTSFMCYLGKNSITELTIPSALLNRLKYLIPEPLPDSYSVKPYILSFFDGIFFDIPGVYSPGEGLIYGTYDPEYGDDVYPDILYNYGFGNLYRRYHADQSYPIYGTFSPSVYTLINDYMHELISGEFAYDYAYINDTYQFSKAKIFLTAYKIEQQENSIKFGLDSTKTRPDRYDEYYDGAIKFERTTRTVQFASTEHIDTSIFTILPPLFLLSCNWNASTYCKQGLAEAGISLVTS